MAILKSGWPKRETQARREERLAAKEDRRDQYQRETLLALQEALAALIRTTATAYLQDKLAYRESGAWHKNYLPDDLAEELREAQSRTALLTERILDDQVRPDFKVRRGAAQALRNTGSSQAVAGLAEALNDSEREVRYIAVIGLGEITRQDEWSPSIDNFSEHEAYFLSYWRNWVKSQQ